ncbi:hypothetical protein PC129_g5341 [Phytophthora cactorum]|uniref:Uncharacterized protein n=2 Tax=Phytophthora cactorum TaxID=29920 RepID=A0A329SHR8_9STRA|nr:hypothetical protein Pcac1_g15311 [Phytophthora cactorum]KAG2819890.1 hypothetical protein PC111_g11698 [Phytophthora cactorum]KAG2832245.1 hypothetical protein PC112_g6971 [Phytophthora cactorum]KAG2861630.1 hypothetical protein PC113_g6999 [Phytophthora cactorum]KAG2924379.1 hypothetical protein PC114_g4514 [Phytophthora cactorum]
MATPTLHRDQHHALRFPPPAPIDFATPRSAQQWVATDDHLRAESVSRFRSATDLDHYPVLPKIASLLKSSSSNAELRNLPTRAEKETMEIRKRKLSMERGRPLMNFEPSATRSPRIVMVMRENGSQETRARCVSLSGLDWDHHTPISAAQDMPNNANIPTVSSAMRRAVYQEFGPRGAAPVAVRRPVPVSTSPPSSVLAVHGGCGNPAERRLYYQHEIHIPAEIPVAPHYHETHSELPRKHARTSRYQRQWPPSHTHPAYYERHEQDIEVNVQKRRRAAPSPKPTPRSRQPLYESEYGLTILETSKPLMRSRYPFCTKSTVGGDDSASRRRYVRTDSNEFERANSSIPSGYNGGSKTNGTADTSTPRAPRTQTIVENCESTSLATLVLKSKEFLQSKSLVRNRHDEIDWVATFLKVGFDSSSIYALMCPLRKGRWKSEEENYTMGLLRLIENGTILLRHGQSIRGYVGEKLHSDDMRVLKKLSNCKMFHFAKLINPRLAEEEKLDMNVEDAQERLEQLDQLKGEFLRSVQLEALVAVRKHLSDNSLRELLNVRA